jgi:hypothetical protein
LQIGKWLKSRKKLIQLAVQLTLKLGKNIFKLYTQLLIKNLKIYWEIWNFYYQKKKKKHIVLSSIQYIIKNFDQITSCSCTPIIIGVSRIIWFKYRRDVAIDPQALVWSQKYIDKYCSTKEDIDFMPQCFIDFHKAFDCHSLWVKTEVIAIKCWSVESKICSLCT